MTQPGIEKTPQQPKLRAVDAGIPDDQWKKLHPVSAFLKTWHYALFIVIFLLFQNVPQLIINFADVSERWLSSLFLLGIGILIFLFSIAVVGLYSWVAWSRTRYALTDEAVWYRTGILRRTQRHARLDRIQAVDVIHPLLGRLFGLGQLQIEVAGGADSKLVLGHLKTSQLTQLRADILALAAGLKASQREQVQVPGQPGASAPHLGPAGDPRNAHTAPSAFPEAEERILYRVGTGRLIGSAVLSYGLVFSVFIFIVGIVGIGILSTQIKEAGIAYSFLLFLPVWLLGFIGVVWSAFQSEFNFTAAVSLDGIRIRKGLTATRSQTIPPRRVHAVNISQPFLWRGPDWYRVSLVQAGYGGANSEGNNSSGSLSQDLLLPVGTREEAELALWLVVSDLGVENPRDFIEEAFRGKGSLPGSLFVSNPSSSVLLDPLTWKRRAFALTATSLVIREGRINRSVTVTPIERMQSAALCFGPLQRMLKLCSVHMHIVPGKFRAHVINTGHETGLRLFTVLNELSHTRRAKEPPEKWMQRISSQLPHHNGAISVSPPSGEPTAQSGS